MNRLLGARITIILLSVSITSCAPTPSDATSLPSPSPTEATSSALTPSPAASATPTSTATATAVPTLPAFICGAEGAIDPQDRPITFDEFDSQLAACVNALADPTELSLLLNSSAWTIDRGDVEFRARVEYLDVTADAEPDIIIDLFYYFAKDDMFGQTFYIFVWQEGQFQNRSSGNFGSYAFHLDTWNDLQESVREIRDLNRNGVPEIVLAAYFGERDSLATEFKIIQWDGRSFVDLIAPRDNYLAGCQYQPNSACVQFGDGGIADVDGDGDKELALAHNRRFMQEECAIQDPSNCYPSAFVWYIWEWDGQDFAYSRTLSAPRYRIQAIRDADALSWDAPKAIGFYQEAIFDDSLLAWHSSPFAPSNDFEERSRLSAYARYRLVVLHVAEGNTPAAETAYDTLQRLYPTGTPGSKYAELAREFWEVYQVSGDIAQACARAVEFAASNSSDVLDPLGGDSYRPYYSWKLRPDSVCPHRF